MATPSRGCFQLRECYENAMAMRMSENAMVDLVWQPLWPEDPGMALHNRLGRIHPTLLSILVHSGSDTH